MAAVALVRRCLAFLLLSGLFCPSLGFHSNVHHAAGRGLPGGFRLYSVGQLRDVMWLDSASNFTYRLGSDGHLRVQPLTPGDLSALWWPGRPLLGRKVPQLCVNGSVLERSLLRKVKAVHPLDSGLVKVELESARNADLIKTGVIRMQFSPALPPSSGGQDNSASLQKQLPGSEVTASPVTLHTDSVQLVTSTDGADVQVTSGSRAATSDPSPGLEVKLIDFQETHRLHPSLHVDISNDGTSKECYRNRMTLEVALWGTLEVRASREVGVERRHLVSSRPRRLLHRLPLLLPPSSPLLHLLTSQSSATRLEVYVTTSGPLHVRGSFNASGDVILESVTCNGELPKSTLNFAGWSVVASPWSGQSYAHFHLQVSLYNEVRYESCLHWEGISEPVKTLPAVMLSLKPKVTVKSSVMPDSVCLDSDLHLHGSLRLEDTGQQRSQAALMGEREVSGKAWSGRVLHQCSAPCHQDTPTSAGVSVTTVCGVPTTRLSREDAGFGRLQVLQGEEVQYRGEETACAWCGRPGQPCPPCHPPSPHTTPCADRVMAPDAARFLSRLSRLARLEWSERKVLVEEAWDEPDELHPFGRHGNQSLHYEGRALLLTLTSDPGPLELRRLAQLALCAGFPFADVTSSSVAVCTAASQSEKSTRHRRSVASSDLHELNFQKFIQSIDADTLSESVSQSPLPVGESFPPNQTLTQVLGPPLDSGAAREKLYQYTYDDVQFPPEGQAGERCQDPPRQCQTSCQASQSPDPWNWCRHRALTPRMAVRLSRLAALVRQRLADFKAESLSEGSFGTSESGRALTVSLPSGSRLSGDEFSALAKQAGFDYLTRESATSLRVYVRRQEGYLARLVAYQSNSFIAVLSPSSDYDLPPAETNATGMPTEETPLLDGHDPSLPVSAHYRVEDFAHPDHRFLRLHPVLLDCLELAAEDLGSPPRVEPGWAFRPAPVNRVNLSSRHPEERENFQRGRAVFVKPLSSRYVQEGLLKMATALVGKCVPLLLRIHRKLGLGCHGDKLYVDVRGMTSEDADQARYVQLWDVDNAQLYQSLTQIVTQISKGGPVIAPVSESRSCKPPELGEALSYFSFSVSPYCEDFANACLYTTERREEVADEMTQGLYAVLRQVLSPSAISQAVRECLVSHCGGCLGAGDIWKKKMHACAKLVKLFSEYAPSPWGEVLDTGAFLNPHTPKSSLHALACQQGSLCLENTQLYSLAQKALQARYKPDPGKSREELLFSGEDNPSPLLEVIQQEMAHSMQGKVKVYLEREGDLGILKDTLKVLMVHNTDVTEVELHFADVALQDRVLPRLQRHLEGWALRACPRWSRFAVAPFSAHVIPPSRLRRSAEQSGARNAALLALQGWERAWLLRV